MVGITPADYQNELDAFSADYLSIDQDLEVLYDEYVVAIAIGNEQHPNQINNMKGGIQYAKTLINGTELLQDAKITTVLMESPEWLWRGLVCDEVC